MRDGEYRPSLGRELLLRTVPLAIVAASAWWFLDASPIIFLLPGGVALLVLLGRALRALPPASASDKDDASTRSQR